MFFPILRLKKLWLLRLTSQSPQVSSSSLGVKGPVRLAGGFISLLRMDPYSHPLCEKANLYMSVRMLSEEDIPRLASWVNVFLLLVEVSNLSSPY